LAVLIGCPAPAQEVPQTLARELLREMIETDTTGEQGDTTPLANALAARFRKAGFPAEAASFLLLKQEGTDGISGIPVDRDDVRAHGKDERIRVKDFEGGVRTFALLLWDIAGQER
jgi:acetylornithine deacetylase/succinyl-diaminopimelate desuccinylase-like protein